MDLSSPIIRTPRKNNRRRDYHDEGFIYFSVKMLDDASVGTLVETMNGTVYQKDGSNWSDGNGKYLTSLNLLSESLQLKMISE